MTSPPAEDIGNLVDRPIWAGLMGSDADGPYLIGGKCSACGFTTLGVRDTCPECWARGGMMETPNGREGTLYTITDMQQLPRGYGAPLAVG